MRKFTFILFMVLLALSAYGSFAEQDYISAVFSLAGLVSLWFVNNLTNQVLIGSGNNLSLTENEKKQVIITEIFLTIIAGAFYYYGWKNKFPKKASEANKYSWIIAGIEIVIYVAYTYITGKSL